MAHSFEYDTQTSPMILLKVDIEKAYDTIEWNVILATLKKMNFSSIWIEHIKTCLQLASFSFLINGVPSK